MYPNVALSAWQMTLMAVVPVVAMAVWLIAIYVAAREPSRRDLAAAGSPAEPVTAGTAEHAPERPPTDRMAA